MNLHLIPGVILWVSSAVAALSPITLKPGPNYLDLNRDKVNDIVVMAQFDNNTSHPNLGLTFFVSCAGGGYCIIPVANSNLFTWFDYRLSADADFLLQDNRLYQLHNSFYMVSALKNGENPFDMSEITLRIYKFTESREDPGVPLYDWTLYNSLTTKKSYLSATEAYQEVDDSVFQNSL